jgi:hypothetical protein
MDLVSITRTSPVEAKIALFRSLFRGRVDVYPRRFESRRRAAQATLRPVRTSGCAESARSRASSVPTVHIVGSFLSQMMSFDWHLSGHDAAGQPFVVGVYPLLDEEPWTSPPSRRSRERG